MRSALLSRSLTRPLSAGKGRSRRVDRVLACSASGPLLTPHTRRQGYFRPRGPDTSHLGASSPSQRRSTLAFAEDSCRCRHATAPRAAKSTTSTQCLCATPFVGTVSSQSSARPATVHAQHTQHRRVVGDHGLGPCADPGYTGPAFFACILGRRVSLYVRHRSSGLKAWGMAAMHALSLVSHVTQIVADIRQH